MMKNEGTLLSRLGPAKWMAAASLALALCLAIAWHDARLGGSSSRYSLRPIAFHRPTRDPHIRNKNGTSTNWSGYAVQATATPVKKGGKAPSVPAFNDVKGAWVVPDVTPGTSPTAYSSAWVGIDGDTSNTVEQIGTDSDISTGTPVYYAWFEMYPKQSYEIVGFPVAPGDKISAEVHYNNATGLFELSIDNETQNETYSTTQRAKSALRSSAEWVQEAPSSGGVLPLANFGEIEFSECSATLSNGHTGTISDSAFVPEQINMQTTSGTVKAETSALSADGTSFSVTWMHQ